MVPPSRAHPDTRADHAAAQGLQPQEFARCHRHCGRLGLVRPRRWFAVCACCARGKSLRLKWRLETEFRLNELKTAFCRVWDSDRPHEVSARSQSAWELL